MQYETITVLISIICQRIDGTKVIGVRTVRLVCKESKSGQSIHVDRAW